MSEELLRVLRHGSFRSLQRLPGEQWVLTFQLGGGTPQTIEGLLFEVLERAVVVFDAAHENGGGLVRVEAVRACLAEVQARADKRVKLLRNDVRTSAAALVDDVDAHNTTASLDFTGEGDVAKTTRRLDLATAQAAAVRNVFVSFCAMLDERGSRTVVDLRKRIEKILADEEAAADPLKNSGPRRLEAHQRAARLRAALNPTKDPA